MAEHVVQRLYRDVLIEVVRNLQATDIQNFALACRSFRQILQEKTVWLDVLRRDVYSKHVPTPQYRGPLDSLSADACRVLAVHPVRLQRVLAGADTNLPHIVSLSGSRSVTWVHLVHGQWLLVASSHRTTSAISLWDISSFYYTMDAPPPPVCESYLEGPVYSGLVDVQDGEVVVALEIHAGFSKRTAILKVVLVEGSRAFFRLDVSLQIAWLRALRGPWIGFSVCEERSVPGVFNWVNKKLILLANSPDPEGGALAMDIRDNIVAAISPAKVVIFSLEEGENREQEVVRCLLEIKLAISVGFADIKILEPPLENPAAGRELRYSIAGEDGISLYSISLGLPGAPAVVGEEAIQLWHQPTPPRDRDAGTFRPFKPIIDASGTVSWLEGCAPYIRTPAPQINFHTLSHRPINPSSASTSPSPSVYVLNHPRVPTLYAMGVYDFDSSLGFVVFGNYYGELAFFDLSGPGTNIEVLGKCLPMLRVQPPTPPGCVSSQTPIPTTFGLTLPYCEPHANLSHDVGTRISEYWQSFPAFPRNVPPQWEVFPFDDEDDTSWTSYVRRLPRYPEDRAWLLEHVYHFYGTPVPLMRNDESNYEMFQVGGLLFYMTDQDFKLCYAVETDLSPAELAANLNMGSPPPSSKVHQDAAAFLWYENVFTMRAKELKDGRDRWAEMKARGGDVDEVWLGNQFMSSML